ncbi:hypothetical protein BDR26DRAFT_915326 [Obelidium mucronatum]|nr:hypothetical protein BDR26DRAFT_915326 [Obelidium mucronatum]
MPQYTTTSALASSSHHHDDDDYLHNQHEHDAAMSESDSGSDCEFGSPATTATSRSSKAQQQRPRKKAGRKSITANPNDDKKIARNRKAQRAFRERKEAHLHGLEETVKQQAARIQELMAANEKLKMELEAATRSAATLDHTATTISLLSPTLSVSKVNTLVDSCTAVSSRPKVVVGSPTTSPSSLSSSIHHNSPPLLYSPENNVFASFLFHQQQQQQQSNSTTSLFDTSSSSSPFMVDGFSNFLDGNSLLSPSSLLMPTSGIHQSLDMFDASCFNSFMQSSVKQETPLV